VGVRIVLAIHVRREQLPNRGGRHQRPMVAGICCSGGSHDTTCVGGVGVPPVRRGRVHRAPHWQYD